MNKNVIICCNGTNKFELVSVFSSTYDFGILFCQMIMPKSNKGKTKQTNKQNMKNRGLLYIKS